MTRTLHGGGSVTSPDLGKESVQEGKISTKPMFGIDFSARPVLGGGGGGMRQIRTVEGKLINVAAPQTQKKAQVRRVSPYIEIWMTWGAERQKRKFDKRMDKVWDKLCRLGGLEEADEVMEEG